MFFFSQILAPDIDLNIIFQSELHYRHFNNMKMRAQGMTHFTSWLNYFVFNLETNFQIQWSDFP